MKLIIEIELAETSFGRAMIADAASAAFTSSLEEATTRRAVETGSGLDELVCNVLEDAGLPIEGDGELIFRVEE